MNTSVEGQEQRKDGLLWSVVFFILAGVVVGNLVYSDLSVLIRAVAAVVSAGIAGFVALQTTKGQEALAFARESRLEIRKVVWPTRPETVQTTLVVFAFTAVTGVMLLLLDGVLVWLVSFFTGVKG